MGVCCLTTRVVGMEMGSKESEVAVGEEGGGGPECAETGLDAAEGSPHAESECVGVTGVATVEEEDTAHKGMQPTAAAEVAEAVEVCTEDVGGDEGAAAACKDGHQEACGEGDKEAEVVECVDAVSQEGACNDGGEAEAQAQAEAEPIAMPEAQTQTESEREAGKIPADAPAEAGEEESDVDVLTQKRKACEDAMGEEESAAKRSAVSSA